MIKFTVVTCTYNAERVLQRTLDSVNKQTYCNIEHLIIDGVSKDKTLAMVRAYQNRAKAGENAHEIVVYKSARPLRLGRHTCYNGGYRRKLPREGMRILKGRLSSDWSLQPDSTKLDSLVIAHQPWRGEYVPGPCTHRPSSHESRWRLKYVTARSVLGRKR